MATSAGVPLAMKVFFLSLITGVGTAYGAFHVAMWAVMKYWEGQPEPVAVIVAVLASVVVGISSAITAGVLVGRATRS